MEDYVYANDLKILNICLNAGQICVACTESDQSCLVRFLLRCSWLLLLKGQKCVSTALIAM